MLEDADAAFDGLDSVKREAVLGGEVVFNTYGPLQFAATLVGIDEQLDRKVAMLPGGDFRKPSL